MSTDVTYDLYRASHSRPFFWIDDVFISGILAQDINIKHVDLSERVSITNFNFDNWLRSDDLTLPPIFGLPNSDTKNILSLWNKTVSYYKAKFNYSFYDE